MALISCPECKNKISESAECCPKCGFGLNKSSSEEKIKLFLKYMSILLIGYLIFMGIIMIFTNN